ncbi:MAG TPA: hypothetical protein VL974_16705, partial [Magnetospirillum sp.]|nr:hypothetical protein [Magnetospirillum sp.]
MTEHLQINDVAPCVHYLADGVQAAFVFPFAVFKAFDLEVWLDGGQVCSGFSVSGVGISSGGAVLFAVPPAAATRVTLRRRLALERTTDFQADGIIRAKTLNDELDYQVAAVQQVADDLSRCVRRPFTSASAADLSLPDPSPGKALGWSADGAALVNDPADFAATLASVTAQASQVSQGAAAAAASGAAAQVASTAAQAAAQQAQAAVGGVRVSATDSTARPLTESLIAGDHLAVTVQNGGGDESLRLDVTGLGGLAVKDSLTPADLVGVASGTLLGRASTGNGGAEAISLGSSLRLVGGVLDCTSGTDILARDQIALTNLRLLLNSAVSSGALFQGMQWELASDEWAAGSSGYAFNSSSPNYYGNIGFPVAV